MRRIVVFFSIVLLFTISTIFLSSIYSKNDKLQPSRQPASLNIPLPDRLIAIMPESYKNGIQEYLRMIGQESYGDSTWAANSGLADFNGDLLTNNSCFLKLAQDFYNFPAGHASTSYGIGMGNITFSIDQSTRNTPAESGWLWDRAIQFSNGDQNLAMTLIGICGHDNMSHFSGGSRYIMNPPIQCPSSTSAMYVQGALGEQTILPDRTVREITRIQAPYMGAKALPSKYFHTMGAAHLACSLVRAGIPGPLVRRAQRMVAHTYRTMRLCDTTSHYGEIFGSLENMSMTEFSTFFRRVQANPSECYFRDPNVTGIQFHNTPTCTLLAEVTDSDPESYNLPGSYTTLRRKLEEFLGRVVAARLFRQEILRGESCRQIQYFRSLQRRMGRFRYSGSCGNGVTVQRCQEARRVMGTWYADFLFSEEQHVIGANFAIQNCTSDPNFLQNIQKRSCSALESTGVQTQEGNGIEVSN